MLYFVVCTEINRTKYMSNSYSWTTVCRGLSLYSVVYVLRTFKHCFRYHSFSCFLTPLHQYLERILWNVSSDKLNTAWCSFTQHDSKKLNNLRNVLSTSKARSVWLVRRNIDRSLVRGLSDKPEYTSGSSMRTVSCAHWMQQYAELYVQLWQYVYTKWCGCDGNLTITCYLVQLTAFGKVRF